MGKNFYGVDANLACLKMESKHKSWMRCLCRLAKDTLEISHFYSKGDLGYLS